MFKKKPKEGAVFVCEDPDIGLEDFLTNVGCEEYIQTFKTAGAKKVEDLVVLDNDDLKQMLPLIPYRKLKHSLEDFEKRHLRRRSKSFGGGGKKEAPSKAGPKASTASSSSSLAVSEASPEKTSTLRSVGSQGSGGNEHTYVNTQQQQAPVVAAATSASPLEEDQPEYEDPDKQPEDDNGDYEVPHEPGETVEIKPQPLPANPNLWSNADVLRWLKENNLGEFKDIIYANGFSGDQLLSVNIASFRKAFSEEQCETLGRAISTLRNSANGSSAQPAAAAPAAAAPAAQAAPKANASSGRYVNMNEGKMIKAVYSFSATTPKQLSITAGEILTVVDDSKNWWTVRNAAGNQGVVPSNYVEYHEYTNDSPIIGGPVPQEDPLERKIYFHGSITRQDAERLLSGKDWGTFLIRTSQSEPNCFTLSISGKSTNIIHLQIAKVDGKFALGKGAAAEYNSVEELVDLHKSSEIKVTGKESILLRFPCQKQ